MVIHVPGIVIAIAIPKADVELLFAILLSESQPAFELHLEEGDAVRMWSEEVSSVPIVAERNSDKAEISQNRRYLLKVVGFLLAAVEILILDFIKVYDH